MKKRNEINTWRGAGVVERGGLENPIKLFDPSDLEPKFSQDIAGTHRESVKRLRFVAAAVIGAAAVLVLFSEQTNAAEIGPSSESGECRILWGALPCSTGPYHINTGGNGPDMGITPTNPGKPSSKRPTRPTNPVTPDDEPEDDCPPEHEVPADDGVGGPYGGWDTSRKGGA